MFWLPAYSCGATTNSASTPVKAAACANAIEPAIIRWGRRLIGPNYSYDPNDLGVLFDDHTLLEDDNQDFYRRLIKNVLPHFIRHHSSKDFDRNHLSDLEIKLLERIFNDEILFDSIMFELSNSLPSNRFLLLILELTPEGLKKGQYLGHFRIQQALPHFIQSEKAGVEQYSREELLLQSDKHSRKQLETYLNSIIHNISLPAEPEIHASPSDLKKRNKQIKNAIEFYQLYKDEIKSILGMTDKLLGKKFKDLIKKTKLKIEEIEKTLHSR